MAVKYHFFGKELEIDKTLLDRSNLDQNLQQQDFNNNKTLLLNQIHSNEVFIVDNPDKIYGNQNLPQADAIITNQRNINIGVITADCAPILLFCQESKIIGAAHAGWQGAKSGIISNSIKAMQELGAKNIKAIIGPMIQQQSYEISPDFYEDFLKESANNQQFFIAGTRPQKYLFDLNGYVEDKLKTEFVEVENLKIDTYSNPSKYFSYRLATHKSQKNYGRNLSIICQQD